VEAIARILGAGAARRLGPHVDRARRPRSVVVTGDHALVVAREDDVRVVRTHSDVAAFAATNVVCIELRYHAQIRVAGHADGAVFLLWRADAVRGAGVRRDVVELTDPLVRGSHP